MIKVSYKVLLSMQFGDASGIQSPVSFGGFGSLTRHLGRLSNGIYIYSLSDSALNVSMYQRTVDNFSIMTSLRIHLLNSLDLLIIFFFNY